MARIGATLKKTASACIALAVLAILLALMLVGYLFFERQVAAEVYRDRLAEISGEYEQLRERYNTAISKTAVTELEVAGGVLTVRVRDAGGVIREIPTELDPSGEIYVDYVVLDGRLWIRRVFDANTPPAEALVIDPELADIEWPTGELAHGKAVYRSLDEGRWMVTVTGNGSLGLGPAPTEAVLESGPAVASFDAMLEEADTRVEAIGPGEVLGRLLGSN